MFHTAYFIFLTFHIFTNLITNKILLYVTNDKKGNSSINCIHALFYTSILIHVIGVLFISLLLNFQKCFIFAK